MLDRVIECRQCGYSSDGRTFHVRGEYCVCARCYDRAPMEVKYYLQGWDKRLADADREMVERYLRMTKWYIAEVPGVGLVGPMTGYDPSNVAVHTAIRHGLDRCVAMVRREAMVDTEVVVEVVREGDKAFFVRKR